MTTQLSAHLTEEALEDALIGLISPDAGAHLATCGVCRGQLEAFRAEMQVFNQASLAWSEARAAHTIQVRPRRKVRSMIYAPAGWALATMVFLAIGIPVWHHGHNTLTSDSTASLSQDSEAQIEQDNDLLRSVDLALRADDSSPLREYHLPNGPHSQLRSRSELRNQ